MPINPSSQLELWLYLSLVVLSLDQYEIKFLYGQLKDLKSLFKILMFKIELLTSSGLKSGNFSFRNIKIFTYKLPITIIQVLKLTNPISCI